MKCPECKGDFLQPIISKYYSDIWNCFYLESRCPYCGYVFQEVETL